MMRLDIVGDIIITKSKKTLDDYEEYWQKILSLIEDKIETIIQK